MGMDDPLSSSRNAEDEESDAFISADPLKTAFGHSQIPVSAGRQYGGGDVSASSDFAPTSVDTMASYGQLLGPPSYEDANLFDQVEIRPASPERDGRAKGTGEAAAAPSISISVDDPVKQTEQTMIPGYAGGYVTYRISTRTTQEGYAKPQFSVRRRFRDVVSLHELLKQTHRGYIIPPRPEKNTVEGQRASEEFVEGRRVAVQHYLNQLAAHPVIGRSEELQTFLETEGPLGISQDWQRLQPLQSSFLDGATRLPKQLLGQDRAIPTPTESAQSTKATGDLLRRFKELRQSVKNDHVEPPRLDASETSLREETRQIEAMQEHLAEASKRAEAVVAKMEEAGNALGDFGLSLVKLCKFEDDEGPVLGVYTQQGAATKRISADCKRTGMAAVRLSRLAKVANEQTITALEPLHTNLALSPAVLKALREREAQLLTVQALEADIAKKHKALGVLDEQGQRTFGNEASKGRKQEAIQNDMAALEMALDSAKAEFQKITTRNREDLARWEKERRSAFYKMQDAFLRVETAFQEREASVWLALSQEFSS